MRVLALFATLTATMGLSSAYCTCPNFAQTCCTKAAAPYSGGAQEACDVTTKTQFDAFSKCCLDNSRFAACTAFPWL